MRLNFSDKTINMLSPDFQEVSLQNKELKICRFCGYDHRTESLEAHLAHEYQAQELGCRCYFSHSHNEILFQGTE